MRTQARPRHHHGHTGLPVLSSGTPLPPLTSIYTHPYRLSSVDYSLMGLSLTRFTSYPCIRPGIRLLSLLSKFSPITRHCQPSRCRDDSPPSFRNIGQSNSYPLGSDATNGVRPRHIGDKLTSWRMRAPHSVLGQTSGNIAWKGQYGLHGVSQTWEADFPCRYLPSLFLIRMG